MTQISLDEWLLAPLTILEAEVGKGNVLYLLLRAVWMISSDWDRTREAISSRVGVLS